MSQRKQKRRGAPAAEARPPILEMRGISKSFGAAKALTNVDLTVWPGEVHALMGENGAGKSTLMKILAGAYITDTGTIKIDGKETVIDGPVAALAAGITLIYQEINLAPNLTVAENIFLNGELTRRGFVDRRSMIKEADKVLAKLNASFGGGTVVGSLTIAEQQLVEIARALHRDSRILVMDEPTAALSSRETDRLFELIHSLRRAGIAIIYISHRMAEIYALADRVSVLRDGSYIGSLTREELSAQKLVQMMVGRPLEELFEKERHADYSRTVLEVSKLTDGRRIHPATFKVHAGEVLGLSGVVGAGRTELARLVFGADKIVAGDIRIEGKPLTIRNPIDAISAGIAYLPEDRKVQGLFLDMTVRENIVISVVERLANAGWLNRDAAKQLSDEAIRRLRIRVASPQVTSGSLSGGNQQKLLVSRWVAIGPKVLILDEPTRGVDVGAKHDIYHQIGELTKQGVAVILISSELPEVIGLSDRVLVMREGMIAGEVGGPGGQEITQENIMALATGSSAMEHAAAVALG